MAIIVPTITAENPHVYRDQIERVQGFAKRIHIDLMDGVFTPNISVTLEQLWWPEDTAADIHLMFAKPESQLEALIALKPNLVVIHAESDCDVANFAKKLSEAGILCGIALLPETQVSVITPYIQHLSHVLVFSGNLGHQGGSVADLDLLSKVSEIRSLSSDLEIAWDGGVNDTNAPALAEAGVQVLNTGGYIHFAYDAQKAYSALKNVIDEK